MASMPARRKNPFQYQLIEDVERLEMYQSGGYHPVAIGDKLHDRYRVVDKLGHGSYSTIWLARDTRSLSQRLVAVKVGIAKSNFREVEVLLALTTTPRNSKSVGRLGKAMMPLVLDSFTIRGPNGIHPCYTTALARVNLIDAKAGSDFGMFRLDVARALAAQLTLAVAFTHSHGVVHGGTCLTIDDCMF